MAGRRYKMGERTRLRIRGPKAQERKCPTDKFTFPDKASALDAAEVLMEQGKVLPGCHQTPYACALCGGWHVYNRYIIPMRASDRHAPEAPNG